MTIEILERGILPEDVPYKKRCGYCQSLISFLKRDTEYHGEDYGEPYLSVMCPVCNRTIYVTEDDKRNET